MPARLNGCGCLGYDCLASLMDGGEGCEMRLCGSDGEVLLAENVDKIFLGGENKWRKIVKEIKLGGWGCSQIRGQGRPHRG